MIRYAAELRQLRKLCGLTQLEAALVSGVGEKTGSTGCASTSSNGSLRRTG